MPVDQAVCTCTVAAEFQQQKKGQNVTVMYIHVGHDVTFFN